MLVPEEVKKSVVFIGCNTKKGVRFGGTAFFVGIPVIEIPGQYYPYLVTAKHNIEKIKKYSIDGKVIIRFNREDGSSHSIITNIDSWTYHPTETNVDIAVIPSGLSQDEFDFLTIPEDFFLTNEKIEKDAIGVGDEVFLAGLFTSHYGKQKNLPIIRVGNISLMGDEKVETSDLGPIDAYLVEVRSIGGLSGSPVFVHTGPWRTIKNVTNFSPPSGRAFHLLGLMHGHYNISTDAEDGLFEDAYNGEKLHMGIAVVVPAMKILEVLNQEKLIKLREETLKNHK